MCDDTRELNRKARTGKKASKETLKKMSVAHTGKKVSKETKKKMSKAQQKFAATEIRSKAQEMGTR